MKKIIIILILFLSVPALASFWSDNISITEGWDIRYQKEWNDSPYILQIANVSGAVAIDIAILIFYDDFFGKEISVETIRIKGPLKSGYQQTRTLTDYPKNTHKLRAEVFCDWK